MTDKVQKIREKVEKLKKLADAMYDAAQYLTTDASRLHKAMDEYHKFIIYEYHKEEPTIHDIVDEHYWEMLGEEPVILTEETLKKNGFELNPRPRYKEPFWSELFTASDGRKYYFKINMEQRVEALMTIEPLATDDGHGHPTCYLPHPKTIQQLEKSLRLFNIKYVIKV